MADSGTARMLVLADSDDAAVTAMRSGFDSASVVLMGDGAVPLEKDDLYDDIVVALTFATPAALTTALAVCADHLHPEGAVRLAVPRSHGEGFDDTVGGLAGYCVIDVDFRDGDPYLVLVREVDGAPGGPRLGGILTALRAAERAGLFRRGASDDARHSDGDLAGQIVVGRAAEDQLAARVDHLQAQLEAARSEGREIQASHDRLSRSKLGRLTVRYWGLKRQLRAGRRRAAIVAMLRRSGRPILLAAVLAAWLAVTTITAREYDWSLTRWLVVQLILLTVTLVLLQVKGQRLVIREMEDLRRRAGRDRKAATDNARAVAGVRAGLDKVAKQLDAVSRQASRLAEADEVQLGAVRAARAAVTDLTYQLARRLPVGDDRH